MSSKITQVPVEPDAKVVDQYLEQITTITARAAREKAHRRFLAQLREQWKYYSDSPKHHAHSRFRTHVGQSLVACRSRCGCCDGCASEQWRRDRQATLSAVALVCIDIHNQWQREVAS